MSARVARSCDRPERSIAEDIRGHAERRHGAITMDLVQSLEAIEVAGAEHGRDVVGLAGADDDLRPGIERAQSLGVIEVEVSDEDPAWMYMPRGELRSEIAVLALMKRDAHQAGEQAPQRPEVSMGIAGKRSIEPGIDEPIAARRM